MDYVYIAVSSKDKTGWADSFLLARDKDPEAEVKTRFPGLANIKIQVCEPTRIG
jgi:hypothetical protein